MMDDADISDEIADQLLDIMVQEVEISNQEEPPTPVDVLKGSLSIGDEVESLTALSDKVELIDLEKDRPASGSKVKLTGRLPAITPIGNHASISADIRVKCHKTLDKRFKFCPCCGNILKATYADKDKDTWRRKCHTCPYMQPIKRRHRYLAYTYKDEDEEECQIVETSKADEHRQRTEILCPKCSHKEAFFYQMQTRSADEPMTTFYECVIKTCRYNWRE